MEKKFPELRSWKKLVGMNGDLVDVVTAILSLVSLHHGIVRLTFAEFQQTWCAIVGEFTEKMPQINFINLGTAGRYSRELDDALVAAYSLGVIVHDPQHIGVSNSAVARNLQRLSNRLGHAFIDVLRPVADRFAEILRQGH